jgi:hypothetical protein
MEAHLQQIAAKRAAEQAAAKQALILFGEL